MFVIESSNKLEGASNDAIWRVKIKTIDALPSSLIDSNMNLK
jgi:hypothetical protein